jgi:oligoribonuclease
MNGEISEKRPDALLWLDIETTGLDPERDRILEAEMRITDMRGGQADDGVHVIIPVGERLDISHAALEMHTGNRLLDEVLRSDRSRDNPIEELRAYVDEMSSYYTLHPAGSSVHFDMDFLSRLAPCLLDGCHHRRLDVSSLRMAFEAASVNLPAQEPTNHRTSTCLDRDITQYRRMLHYLKNTQPAVLSDLEHNLLMDGEVRGE